jgi:hypothetical protein
MIAVEWSYLTIASRQQGPIPWQLEGLLYGEVVHNPSDTACENPVLKPF